MNTRLYLAVAATGSGMAIMCSSTKFVWIVQQARADSYCEECNRNVRTVTANNATNTLCSGDGLWLVAGCLQLDDVTKCWQHSAGHCALRVCWRAAGMQAHTFRQSLCVRAFLEYVKPLEEFGVTVRSILPAPPCAWRIDHRTGRR
jgi:hypothetical protein